MTTRTRSVVLLGAVAVVAACVVVTGLWLANRSNGSAGPQIASSPGSTPAKAPPGQADQVVAALRKLATDPQTLVASGARSQVAGRARQAIPTGSTVVADAKSWAPDGLGGGTMLVTITTAGHAPVSYDAVMVREAGQWKVLATIRVPGPAALSPSGASS